MFVNHCHTRTKNADYKTFSDGFLVTIPYYDVLFLLDKNMSFGILVEAKRKNSQFVVENANEGSYYTTHLLWIKSCLIICVSITLCL